MDPIDKIRQAKDQLVAASDNLQSALGEFLGEAPSEIVSAIARKPTVDSCNPDELVEIAELVLEFAERLEATK